MLRRKIGSYGFALIAPSNNNNNNVRYYVYRPPGTRGTALPWHTSSSHRNDTTTSSTTIAAPVTSNNNNMTPEVKIQKPSLETITTVEENDPPYNMLMEEDEDNWMGNAASPAFINRGRNRFSNSHLSPVSAVEAPKKETVEERVIQPTTTAPDVAEVPPAPPTPAVSLTPAPIKLEGGLKHTPTRRMSVLSGPSLDTQLGDIITTGGTAANEKLISVVRRLIDADAEGVEDITMADFISMQPRRQLTALNHKKAWLEWMLASAHYKQAARLAEDSPVDDLTALRQAGIVNLQQWVEQPNLVQVSARTRSALDAAVEESVTTYMREVATVVNTACSLEPVLHRWVSDVVGRFVLDSLKISLEEAAAQVTRAQQMNSVASANGAEDDVSEEALALQLMSRESTTTRRGKKAADTTAMHYGKACTLQHYQQFVQKVRLSVRKDYTARHDLPADFAGDAQMELEITQRTYSVIGAAFTQVFKQALPQLPTELRPLHENGYFAFDKLPGLFQQAMSSLQLRDIPVRQFVLHSTANSTTEGGVTEGTGAYDVDATPYPPGTFLTGVEQQDVTLREWSGGPHDPDSNLSRDPAQHEYLSVLRRLKRQTEKLAVMSVLDVLNDSDIVGHGSFSASTPLGLDQLFGPAKLVEDRLVSALQYPSRTGDKPVHFIEASFTSGKTALLGRLLRRAGADEKMALIRYTSTATPFVPGLDDHPVAFPARFWFRAALACAPFLIRVEELFSRSPSEPLWWGHARNWSYENFQKSIYLAAESSGRGRRLTSILVDDMDKVLDSMEQRWRPYVREEGKRNIVSANELLRETPVLESSAEGKEAEQKKRSTALSVLNDASHRRQFMRQWTATTGKSSISEVLQSSFAKLTTCLGQLDLVFTGSRVAPLFLEFSETACRRYYLPLAGGVGLQQRLRVLPLVAAVHALHQRNCLEMPGVLYEVIKNAPALTGKVLESFLSDRIILRNLQTGPTRVVQGTRGAVLLGSYQPQELFVELPLYQRLLRHPRSTRRRLVELLQKQLCSPTRYLNTLVDTTAKDVNSGLVIPCSATSCQVHPFALFTIFSYQESVDMSGGEKDASRDGSVLLNSSPQEMKEVRAWAEVWAEYRATVRYMGTTPERKRNALRVLVHGALLLRSAGVVGAQIDLHLQVPPYGFPLLATSVRSRNRRRRTVEDPMALKAPTTETVRKSIAAYKAFFANSTQTHYPFRPMVGVNGGCDVVCVLGDTLALYDLITTAEELADITLRIAESLLGVVHMTLNKVYPDTLKLRAVQCVTVVSMDYQSSLGSNQKGDHHRPVTALSNDGLGHRSGVSPVLYYVDFGAIFDDHVMDHLRELQQPLGMHREYRTLNDIVDDLEKNHQIHVQHEVIASQEELESLLSPTLMQLIPDATVLPPYDSPVVSAEDLMMEAMLEPEEGNLSNVLDDEDEDMGDGLPSGAELEEAHGDSLLSVDSNASNNIKQAVLAADGENILESADMLGAMLSDSFDFVEEPAALETTTNTDRATYMGTTKEAVTINQESDSSRARRETPAAANNNNHNNNNTLGDVTPDSLSWLHDVLSPEDIPGTLPIRPASLTTQLNALDDDEEDVFPLTTSKRQEKPPAAKKETAEEEEYTDLEKVLNEVGARNSKKRRNAKNQASPRRTGNANKKRKASPTPAKKAAKKKPAKKPAAKDRKKKDKKKKK